MGADVKFSCILLYDWLNPNFALNKKYPHLPLLHVEI